MAELHTREILGFPGTSITLSVEGQKYRVQITDPTGITQWTAGTEYEAKELFFHPFVHGYNAPNLGTVESDDGG